jgi:hypothetical protein
VTEAADDTGDDFGEQHLYNLTNLALNIHSEMLGDIRRRRK